MRTLERIVEETNQIARDASLLQSELAPSVCRPLPVLPSPMQSLPSRRLAGCRPWFRSGFVSEAPEPQNIVGRLETDGQPLEGPRRTWGHLCSCFQATGLRKAHQGVPAARVLQGGAPL